MCSFFAQPCFKALLFVPQPLTPAPRQAKSASIGLPTVFAIVFLSMLVDLYCSGHIPLQDDETDPEKKAKKAEKVRERCRIIVSVD